MSLGLVSTNLKCVMDVFFSKTNILHQLERWRGDPDTQKVNFLFYFWVKNMQSPNTWDCLLNPTWNTWYKRLLFGSVVSQKEFTRHLNVECSAVPAILLSYLPIFGWKLLLIMQGKITVHHYRVRRGQIYMSGIFTRIFL